MWATTTLIYGQFGKNVYYGAKMAAPTVSQVAGKKVGRIAAGAFWASGSPAATGMKITIEAAAKHDRHTLQVLPRRWIIERTFAAINEHRRSVRDHEYLTAATKP